MRSLRSSRPRRGPCWISRTSRGGSRRSRSWPRPWCGPPRWRAPDGRPSSTTCSGSSGCAGRLDVAALDARPGARTCSPRGVSVALALNRHLRTPGERELAGDFVAADFPAGPDENGFLAEDTRAEILDAYAEANRRLFTTYLPGLAADSYASDAATARLASLAPHPAHRSAEPTPGRAAKPPQRRAERSVGSEERATEGASRTARRWRSAASVRTRTRSVQTIWAEGRSGCRASAPSRCRRSPSPARC